jgi:hypothetical protein
MHSRTRVRGYTSACEHPKVRAQSCILSLMQGQQQPAERGNDYNEYLPWSAAMVDDACTHRSR